MRMLVKGEEKPADEVLFWLEQNSNGVTVKAQLGERGWPWNILKFKDDGSVTRIGYISRELGLQLDETKSVVIN